LKKTLIVLVGPTAIGKTAVAIRLARHFHTEVVSADSRQFYKELNIGTAKPTEEELKLAKHHFINSISIHDTYNVGQFETDAINCLDDIFKKEEVAIMVGGSGLFVNAVCHGMDQLPETDAVLRAELKAELDKNGISSLQQKLALLDPEYYAAVDRSNPHRLIRAIEVCLQTGIKYSELRKMEKKERNFTSIKVGFDLEREKLYERINVRVDEMMEAGLFEEAKKFYELRHLNALQTVGYSELFECMDNKVPLEQAIDLIKQNSRRYAKRQLTWFRKDTEIKWFSPENVNEIIEFITQQIGKG
jgi:tRNA dimethylallyltransferase